MNNLKQRMTQLEVLKLIEKNDTTSIVVIDSKSDWTDK